MIASTLVPLKENIENFTHNVGRTNVQNPLNFLTALLADRHKRGRLPHCGGEVMKIKLLLQYVIFWLIIFLICFTSSTLIFSLLELLLKLDNYSFSDFKKMAFFWLNMSAAMSTLVLIIEAKNKRW